MLTLDMGMRREARERAVQFLFQQDLNPAEDLEAGLERYWLSQARERSSHKRKGNSSGARETEPALTTAMAQVRLFADALIRGVVEHWDELDDRIRRQVANWELRRIAAVDRNVLRLAIYEMYYRHDIPPVVSINEAVDIAKKFSTEESGRFVNGILDKMKEDLMRPARIVS